MIASRKPAPDGLILHLSGGDSLKLHRDMPVSEMQDALLQPALSAEDMFAVRDRMQEWAEQEWKLESELAEIWFLSAMQAGVEAGRGSARGRKCWRLMLEMHGYPVSAASASA